MTSHSQNVTPHIGFNFVMIQSIVLPTDFFSVNMLPDGSECSLYLHSEVIVLVLVQFRSLPKLVQYAIYYIHLIGSHFCCHQDKMVSI